MANKSQTQAGKKSLTGSTQQTNTAQRNGNGHQGGASNKKTLEHLLEAGLQDIYSAEKQLLEALPLMAKAADSEELQDAFQHHLMQTKKHVERIEKVCARLGIEKEGESCAAMEGLIEEANKVIEEFEEGPVRDSALIIGAQKVEHYEIATYGSLCELTDVLGYHKMSDILHRTLTEEEQTDHMLTDISRYVNDEAYETTGDQQF